MRQLLLALCLSLAATLLHGSTVSACINDSDTGPTEREFKINYEFKSGYQGQNLVPDSPATEDEGKPVAATWWGIGLLLVATGLVTVRVRGIYRA
jgi:hypothetical protein